MASNPKFFLKTHPLYGEDPSEYTDLYLRHHGSGINSVVLTQSPPKFIKAHWEGSRVSFTSASHEGRKWGLTLRTDGGQRAAWEKVEIVEDGGSSKLLVLEESNGKKILECDAEDSGERTWRGWMVCDWAHEHPQLFWVTDKLKGELPPFCHRVRIVCEDV
ncbi:hypothetical protein MBLNU459_g6373t1 [Dothideomycetes sp. NU459]